MNIWKKALDLHQAGELEAAKACYEALLNTPNFQAEALHQLGLIAAQQSQYEICVEKIQQAIQIDPNRAVFHNHLGNALIQLNAFPQALSHFQTALQLNPDYAEACNNLGRLFHKQKEWDVAQQYYKKATQLNPNYLEAHLNLGLLWSAQKKVEEARQQFQFLLTRCPNTPQVHVQLAQLAIHRQDWEAAHSHYQQLLQITPNSSDAWNNLAALFSKTQQYKQAIIHAQKALDCDPYHASARFNLASFCLQDNQLKEAIWHYSLYLQACPEDSEAYYNLGVARMLSGHLSEAVTSFKKTISLVSKAISSGAEHSQDNTYTARAIESGCNLGALYLRQGRKSLSISAYQQILNLDSQHPIAQYMLDALTQQNIPETAPLSYVKHLFDHYAAYFDIHLTHTLQYQVPQQLYRFSLPYLQKIPLDVLDLGCGTGLSGQAFKAVARYLVGVDISPGMLAEAKKKEIYNALIEEDITHFLRQSPRTYDLLICVDTLVYFGKLDPIFERVALYLKTEAYWAFSIELSQTEGYQLQTTGRYQHSFCVIETLAHQYDFKLVAFNTCLGRQHLAHGVYIGLFLLQKM